MEFSIDLKDSQDVVGYDLDFIHLITDYKQSVCLLSDKIIIRFLLFLVQQKISKRCRLESWVFFAYIISRKRRATQWKKLQSNVSQVKRSPHAKIQLFLSTLKMAEKSRGHSCSRPWTWPFNLQADIIEAYMFQSSDCDVEPCCFVVVMYDGLFRLNFQWACDSETFCFLSSRAWDAQILRLAKNLQRPIIFQGPFYTPSVGVTCKHLLLQSGDTNESPMGVSAY